MLQRDEIFQVHPLRVQKAHCERNLGVLTFFYVILKAILCVQHFCSFGTILYIVNLLKNIDFTVICIHCLLAHAWYE